MTSNRKQDTARHQVLEHAEQPGAYFKNGRTRAHFLCGVWAFPMVKKLILAVRMVGEYVREAMIWKIPTTKREEIEK